MITDQFSFIPITGREITRECSLRNCDKPVMAKSRSVLTLFHVFLVVAILSAANSSSATKSNNSSKPPQGESKCHNMYTYNSNFYAGLNKKIEALLHEVKYELREMKENQKIGKGSNKTIEALHEVKNELSEMREEIKSKENRTSGIKAIKKMEILLHDVKNELSAMRVEIKILKEKKTIGKGTNRTTETLLHEVKSELKEMREEMKYLKENKTTTKEAHKAIKGLLLEVKLELNKLGNETKSLKVYKNCAELYNAGHRISGVYTIDPDNGGTFDVYCDQTTAGGGWTVFQKRLDGTVDFNRDWDDYKRGFGNLAGEYWLGLDKIHRLTKERSRLRVDLEDFNNQTAYAEYDLFGVTDEANKYKLSLGTYSGTAGDSFSYHRGMAFSTKDRDNDMASNPNYCAPQWKGGWWYKACHYAYLNGVYYHGKHSNKWGGVMWNKWKGPYYSAKRAEMKIKPVKA